jgi:hypothetical protein
MAWNEVECLECRRRSEVSVRKRAPDGAMLKGRRCYFCGEAALCVFNHHDFMARVEAVIQGKPGAKLPGAWQKQKDAEPKPGKTMTETLIELESPAWMKPLYQQSFISQSAPDALHADVFDVFDIELSPLKPMAMSGKDFVAAFQGPQHPTHLFARRDAWWHAELAKAGKG